jgi:phthiocerol/phenolphthiocerol synthesis type-I polyketide synthase E
LLGSVGPPDVFFSNQGMVPDLASGDGPIEVDLDTAMSVRDKVPGLGHAVELRVYRSSGGLHVDWWYDTRRMKRATVEALAERFPAALAELVSEAMASSRTDESFGAETQELGLVDLSAE